MGGKLRHDVRVSGPPIPSSGFPVSGSPRRLGRGSNETPTKIHGGLRDLICRKQSNFDGGKYRGQTIKFCGAQMLDGARDNVPVSVRNDTVSPFSQSWLSAPALVDGRPRLTPLLHQGQG